MRNYLLLVLSLLLPTVALAQVKKATITGKILSTEDKKSIPGVFIQELGSQNYTISETNGFYKLLNQRKGKVTLSFSLLGKKNLKCRYS